jgi:hypothetical protein
MLILVPIVALLELHAVANHVRQRPRLGNAFSEAMRAVFLIDAGHRRMRWAWPLMVRWLHEALVQDLFDNAERRVTGTLAGRRARWSPWVRAMRRLAS